MRPTQVSLAPRFKASLTFLPPPLDSSNPLAIIDMARAADVRTLPPSGFGL